MTADADLLLASASPRRAELLTRLGLRLRIEPADIDETPQPDERPLDYGRRMAAEKCAAVVARQGEGGSALPVLAADTIVVLGRRILGKPGNAEEAAAMLTDLAGRRHEVVTAYRVQLGEKSVERAVTTSVGFRLLMPEEITAYIGSGEWQGKAGAYAIQGIAAVFTNDVRGSVTNVVGLPIGEVIADLRAVGALGAWPPAAFGVVG